MVKTIANNNNGMSIRKALVYSGCSKNMYIQQQQRNIIEYITAATAATAAPSSSSTI